MLIYDKISAPYDFAEVIKHHSFSTLIKTDIENGIMMIPYFSNSPHIITITNLGELMNPKVKIEYTGQLDEETLTSWLEHIFQWNNDLGKIEEFFEGSDLEVTIKEKRGMPLLLDFDEFGCLIGCIIGQQISRKAALSITKRLIEKFGVVINGIYFLPTAEMLSSVEISELTEVGLSTRKAEYIKNISEKIVSNELDLIKIRSMTDEEAHETLIQIKGIGRWTVENYLMFALGRQDMFPVADIGIQNALKKLLKLETKPSKEILELHKQKYSPYGSYAAFYLWRSIEN
ncbi:MAG: DNA-3-methyladenine glycosylase 2 family protein [Bacillales bacterium]|jgi:DNA-3-methyladenine glycosylase II|nr:DNA-3-methyladenine glycosylase 2 family protein [Bacillales bacterium]